jgi:hypothetical protein
MSVFWTILLFGKVIIKNCAILLLPERHKFLGKTGIAKFIKIYDVVNIQKRSVYVYTVLLKYVQYRMWSLHGRDENKKVF